MLALPGRLAARAVLRPRARRCLSDLSRHGAVFGGGRMDQATRETFDLWHDLVGAVAAGRAADVDASRLRTIIADNCTFRPPTYFKPWEGGDEMLVLLGCVGDVFGASFTYGRQWLSDDGHQWALEFKVRARAGPRPPAGAHPRSTPRERRSRSASALGRVTAAHSARMARHA